MKILFFGTPDFACPALEKVVKGGHDVLAVVCQPDRPKGRGRKLVSPPVKQKAINLGLSVLQPESLKDIEAIELLKSYSVDIGIVVAYGLMIPDAILDLPQHGFLNIHPSLLPKYRGSSPIQAALANGDTKTGVCVMKVTSQIDEGAVYHCTEMAIADEHDYGIFHNRLSEQGAEDLVNVLSAFQNNGLCASVEQEEKNATYCKKIKKEDTLIDWSGSAREIHHQVRSLSPHPGAMTMYQEQAFKIYQTQVMEEVSVSGNIGQVVAIHKNKGFEVVTGEGHLLVTVVQLQGSRRMSAQDFVNGQGAEVLNLSLRGGA